MDKAAIEDLFRPFGRVDVRRMFGGHGIYADGVMFALQAYGEIYLRVDDQTLPAFEAMSLAPFVFESARGRATMSYRKMPEDAHENTEDLVRWSRLALEAARRVKAAKSARKPAPEKRAPARKA
jgi:DNA transformation protein